MRSTTDLLKLLNGFFSVISSVSDFALNWYLAYYRVQHFGICQLWIVFGCNWYKSQNNGKLHCMSTRIYYKSRQLYMRQWVMKHSEDWRNNQSHSFLSYCQWLNVIRTQLCHRRIFKQFISFHPSRLRSTLRQRMNWEVESSPEADQHAVSSSLKN